MEENQTSASIFNRVCKYTIGSSSKMRRLVVLTSLAFLALAAFETAAQSVSSHSEKESVFEFRLRNLINDYRKDEGLGVLAFDPRLHDLAREHSRNMDRRQVLSHDGFDSRGTRADYRLCVENVAYNYQTPEALLKGWQESPGHNGNMLQPEIHQAAVSKVGDYMTFFACGGHIKAEVDSVNLEGQNLFSGGRDADFIDPSSTGK